MHLGPILLANGMQPPSEPEPLLRYQQALNKVLPKVKLIIWDLDQTFWRGVLAEKTMDYVQRNHDLVIDLSRRGIINSICSHNDIGAATTVLKERGIFDYFVFPQISYGSKGQMVQSIIESCQLHPANVLFVDDHPRLREEVQFRNTGVLAIDPKLLFVADLSGLPESDPNLERLKQYKVLETKQQVKAERQLTDLAFLRSSEIRMRVIAETGPHLERLVDLINRSNQLNFTKTRVTPEELSRRLEDPGFENRCIHVEDRFGDYGVCGFYSLNFVEQRLEQFVFSCRILGMGIEQHVYGVLGRPLIDIRGEVSSALDTDVWPDWITTVRNAIPDAPEAEVATTAAVLMKGGCDLGSMAHLLRSMRPTWRIDTEFHQVNDEGVLKIWEEHTDVLCLALAHRQGSLPADLSRLPWFDRGTWSTRFGEGGHQIYVLSLLQDFGCGTYRHKTQGFVIPCEYFGLNLLDPSTDRVLFGMGAERSAKFRLTGELLTWFRSTFEYLGPISAERLRDNIRTLAASVPPGSTLVLINGAEVDLEAQTYPFDARQSVRHREMNRALDGIVRELPAVRLLDVRKFVRTRAELRDRLFHYQRRVYAEMAEELVRCVDPGSTK